MVGWSIGWLVVGWLVDWSVRHAEVTEVMQQISSRYASMRRRMQMVIEAKGGAAKYRVGKAKQFLTRFNTEVTVKLHVKNVGVKMVCVK